MSVSVKNISLWRKEVENQVGTLAHTLEPVTKAGANCIAIRAKEQRPQLSFIPSPARS